MGLFSFFKKFKKKKVYPIEITDANFNELVKKSPLPVILDVWGPSCPWCQKLVPTIIELSTKYDGKIRVCHLNAASSPKTAAKLGVRGTPTVLYMRKGRIVERIVGFKPQLYFEQAISVLFPEVLEEENSEEEKKA